VKVYSFRKINFRRKGSDTGNCSAAQNNAKVQTVRELVGQKGIIVVFNRCS